ncbi:inositol monophosphatase family protein [Dermabacteraceae bacterium P13095]
MSNDLLSVAVAASEVAARYLRSIDRSSMGREAKTSSHDIVTVHDKHCEKLIREELARLAPGCRIVGEEYGADSLGEGDTPTFFVDPIDGTSFFASGMPNFCVSIGVVLGGRIVAGVVNAPILGWLFTADEERVYLNGRPLRAPEPRREADAMVLSRFPTLNDLNADENFARERHRELMAGTHLLTEVGPAALQLCYVAAGWADACFHTAIKPWDIAAGIAIVRAAGGRSISWPGGREVTGEREAALLSGPCLLSYSGSQEYPLVADTVAGAYRRRYEGGQ